jgi:mRNA interferase RelE/StbE
MRVRKGWNYDLTAKARKALSKLSLQTQQQILDYLTLKVMERNNPRDLGKALAGTKAGLWRYRVDKYRIICQIQDEVLVILVIQIGKRDSVYD